MEQELFCSMMNKLNDLIHKSQDCAAFVQNKEANLADASVDEYNQICKTARQVQAAQDRILRNELYHIIGMANLNDAQMLEFTKGIQKLTSYRTVVKCLAASPTAYIGTIQGESEFMPTCLLNGISLGKENINLE